jgi:hippurate hydrolase
MGEFHQNEFENIEITKLRRELHKIAETGFLEKKTSQFIKDYLMDYGYEFESTAGTGVIAVKKATKYNPNNEAIAYRSDIDALPIKEETNVDFKSQNEGNMHACGHDGHMAMLLRFAAFVSRQKHLDKDLIFLFQPAEEGLGGAKKIMEEGALDKYNIKAMFATHLFPGADEGKIVIKPDTIMSQSTRINVDIHGKSAHGSMPHLGVDAITTAATLIQQYQLVISRQIDPNKMGVITVGEINGGNAANIIPEHCSLKLTTRAHEEETGSKIMDAVKNINDGIAKTTGTDIETKVTQIYPPVVNNNELYQKALETFDKEDLMILKSALPYGEDFAFYGKKFNTLFYLLGTKNEEKGFVHSLHSNKFNFDEKVLLKGMENYIKLTKTMNAISLNNVDNINEYYQSIEKQIDELVVNKDDSLKIYVTNFNKKDDIDSIQATNEFFQKSKYKDYVEVINQTFSDNELLEKNGVDSSHIVEVWLNGKQVLNDLYSINDLSKESDKIKENNNLSKTRHHQLDKNLKKRVIENKSNSNKKTRNYDRGK